MSVWWRFLLPLFCFLLSCVYPHCAHPSGQQRTTYQNSLRLTRFIRTRVQQLLRRYVSRARLHGARWCKLARCNRSPSFTMFFSMVHQKEQQLGDRNFEDKSLALSTLPNLSTDFHRWLQLKVGVCHVNEIRPSYIYDFMTIKLQGNMCMYFKHKMWVKKPFIMCPWCIQDWERLTEASRNLHTYWVHLDRKRVQLERDNGQPRTAKIPTCMESIQLDIKDLMRQVNSQVMTKNTSHPYTQKQRKA